MEDQEHEGLYFKCWEAGVRTDPEGSERVFHLNVWELSRLTEEFWGLHLFGSENDEGASKPEAVWVREDQ